MCTSHFLSQITTKGEDIMVRVETPDNMRNADPSNPLKRSTKKEVGREKHPEVSDIASYVCVIIQ